MNEQEVRFANKFVEVLKKTLSDLQERTIIAETKLALYDEDFKALAEKHQEVLENNKTLSEEKESLKKEVQELIKEIDDIHHFHGDE